MQVNERWKDHSRHPVQSTVSCIQTVTTTTNQIMFLLTSAPPFFFFFFFTRPRGQYCPQKTCRTQSTWTDHYYKAINIFASAESFFIAVKLLLLFSSDCIRDQSRDFFTVFWDRSHHVILENERKRCWVRERLRRCCPFKIINKYYWTFPRLHYHTFFFPFCCILGKEVKIKDLAKEQPSTFRPKPQKLISQSAALGGSAFSVQLQVLMLTNGSDFFFFSVPINLWPSMKINK